MLTSLLDLVKNKATAAAGFQNVPLATPKHHATEGCGCLPAAACCTLLLVQLLVAAAAAVVLLQSNSLQSNKQTARHPFRNIRNIKTTPNFVPKT